VCGILGIAGWGGTLLTESALSKCLAALFRLSESRGKEASGLAIRTGSALSLFKRPDSATRMIRTEAYRRFLRECVKDIERSGDGLVGPFAVIGHARLVTNGVQGIERNNQPVVSSGAATVHNGIIVNEQRLWERYPGLVRCAEVDTEIIPALVQKFRADGASVADALGRAYAEIEGAASIAMLFSDWPGLALASNTGSLYVAESREPGLLLFTSERYFLQRLCAENPSVRAAIDGEDGIRRVEPGQACLVDLAGGSVRHFALSNATTVTAPMLRDHHRARLVDEADQAAARRDALRRCSQCVLPETVPGISFDVAGVCSYCRQHRPFALKGRDHLRQLADRHRRRDGRPDCVVGLSGGRDSCYGLHVVKRELGLNPVAYTYDWALVTDLARRNQSRLCSRLGVEHVIISADIRQKREYIRLNVNAWLRKPDLGLVPLFMAGDKMYFYHYRTVRERTGVDLAIVCGNRFEKTDFKTGFCGVYGEESDPGWRPYDISGARKLRLAAYYAKGFLLNPAYLNRSLPDTALAFYASYVIPHDLERLYDYIAWDEAEIGATLRREYDWEGAGDTTATWRVGDGTAAFYNYIYYTMAGFSEHDTFRSNQIREGLLTREQALKLVCQENRPRFESIRDYAHVIGFDFDYAMSVINRVPRLY
jgi:glutamine---fructose-6-phosphate transaminase (isomerizing)